MTLLEQVNSTIIGIYSETKDKHVTSKIIEENSKTILRVNLTGIFNTELNGLMLALTAFYPGIVFRPSYPLFEPMGTIILDIKEGLTPATIAEVRHDV